jgi:hypothetical protein
MVLKSDSSLKGVVDTLQRLAQPIMIEEHYKNPTNIKILVIGPNTHAIKNENESYKLSTGEHQIILRATRLLNTTICQVNAIKLGGELMVKNIELYPDIEHFEKILKNDFVAEILNYLSELVTMRRGKDLIGRFIDWFREARWS